MGEVSERRVEANRRNAARSTGPRTASGKARSRLNGLKHGLAADVLVPEGGRAAYEATLARWEDQAGPDNVAERHLIRRAAVASVTLDRLDEAREATREDDVRRALARWERGKQHASRRKAQDLKADPGGTVSDLEATAFGCDWLIRQWAALDDALAAGMEWTRGQLDRAQRMLGYPDGRPGLDAEPPVRLLWVLAGAMAPFSVGEPERTPEEAALPSEPAEARAMLRRFLAAQVDRLEELRAEAWEAVEGPEHRAVIIRAAAADTSDEGQLRHRYARDADRVHNAAMRLFFQARGLRRKEYLAIAKEARQSGKTPMAPAGGGWWREVDSDPAPPGFARVDRAAAAAVEPEPGAISEPDPIGPMPEPEPGGGPPAVAVPGADPAPGGATAPETPRRSEPIVPTRDASGRDRNPNADQPLRGGYPSGPINVRWRTEPLAGPPDAPGSLAAADGRGGPAGPPDRPLDTPDTPRRSEPDFAAGGVGDPRRKPNGDQPLRGDSPAGPINVPRRTEPLPDPVREGDSPSRRGPSPASSRHARRRARRLR